MIDINQYQRNGFKGCYYNGGRIGRFKGVVLLIEGDRYLFKRIFVSYMTEDGSMVMRDKEDHVWIMNGKAFKENDVKIGDCVSFSGKVYPYQRENTTCELGVRNPDDIEIIDSYELPSDEEIHEQFEQQLKCETCLGREQCYGICFMC